MADAESKSWTFLKGVGGVAGAVLSAILIYHFTRPTPPSGPPSVVPIEVDGIVVDAATHKLLPKATVTVSLGSDQLELHSDASGRYSAVFDTDGPLPAMINVAGSADGYQSFSNSVPLRPDGNFAEVDLDAVPPPPQPAVTPGAAVQPAFIAPRAAITIKPKPLDFKAAVTKYVKHP